MSGTVPVTKQTFKLCPLQMFTVGGSLATGTCCVTTACQLWVPRVVRDDPFTSNIGGNEPNLYEMENDQNVIDGGRCGLKVADFSENQFRLQHHLHRHHEHPAPHRSPYKIPLLDGGYFYGASVPKAFQMIQELQIGEDTDGNGKIFGKDFDIDLNDDSAPMALAGVAEVLGNRSKVSIKWSDYVNNNFPPQIKSFYPSKWNVAGGARVRVIGGFFHGNIENFTIKIGGNDGTTEVDVDPETINIVEPTKLFFTVPPYTGGEVLELQMTFHNEGDTFDIIANDYLDNLVNTGGDTIVKKQIRYTLTEDSQEVQDIVLADEANYA